LLRGCAGGNATDDCDGNVIDNVVIEKATSDEAENSPLLGDASIWLSKVRGRPSFAPRSRAAAKPALLRSTNWTLHVGCWMFARQRVTGL